MTTHRSYVSFAFFFFSFFSFFVCFVQPIAFSKFLTGSGLAKAGRVRLNNFFHKLQSYKHFRYSIRLMAQPIDCITCVVGFQRPEGEWKIKSIIPLPLQNACNAGYWLYGHTIKLLSTYVTVRTTSHSRTDIWPQESVIINREFQLWTGSKVRST